MGAEDSGGGGNAAAGEASSPASDSSGEGFSAFLDLLGLPPERDSAPAPAPGDDGGDGARPAGYPEPSSAPRRPPGRDPSDSGGHDSPFRSEPRRAARPQLMDKQKYDDDSDDVRPGGSPGPSYALRRRPADLGGGDPPSDPGTHRAARPGMLNKQESMRMIELKQMQERLAGMIPDEDADGASHRGGSPTNASAKRPSPESLSSGTNVRRASSFRGTKRLSSGSTSSGRKTSFGPVPEGSLDARSADDSRTVTKSGYATQRSASMGTEESSGLSGYDVDDDDDDDDDEEDDDDDDDEEDDDDDDWAPIGSFEAPWEREAPEGRPPSKFRGSDRLSKSETGRASARMLMNRQESTRMIQLRKMREQLSGMIPDRYADSVGFRRPPTTALTTRISAGSASSEGAARRTVSDFGAGTESRVSFEDIETGRGYGARRSLSMRAEDSSGPERPSDSVRRTGGVVASGRENDDGYDDDDSDQDDGSSVSSIGSFEAALEREAPELERRYSRQGTQSFQSSHSSRGSANPVKNPPEDAVEPLFHAENDLPVGGELVAETAEPNGNYRPAPSLPHRLSSVIYPKRRAQPPPNEIGNPQTSWWHAVFLFSVASFVACVVTLWAPPPVGARQPSDEVAATDWSDGCEGAVSCICPRQTICADDPISMALLTVARCTAWFDYPLYMMLFLSKAHNLNNYLQTTLLRCWINFSDYHKVHGLFGVIVGIESTSHSFFHILRWARRNNDIQLLWSSSTGITGMIVLMTCPLVVLPMVVPIIKKKMPFELRKGLHYLSIVWGAALMHHAPQRIFWLIGVPFFIYLADKLVGFHARTHLLESAYFERLSDSVCLVSFENPPGFGKQNAAYACLMLPWLSKYQFHAFTVFPSPMQDKHSSICISKAGSWTAELMKQVPTPAHRTAYVVGPFLSPFSSPAMDKENLLVVASGIGVTPAISLIQKYSNQTVRRVNLVWICRDAGLVEHFLANVKYGDYGYTLIYHTGKERSIVLSHNLPPNVFLFTGRPSLEQTLSGIIYSIVSGDGLPEELIMDHKIISKTPPEMRSKLLIEKALTIYTLDQLFEYAVEASSAHSFISSENNADSARLFNNSLRNSQMIHSLRNSQVIRRLSHASANEDGLNEMRHSSRERKILQSFALTQTSMRSLVSNSSYSHGGMDYPTDTVIYQGLVSITQQLLGDDYRFVEENLKKNFELRCVSGGLDRDGFEGVMRLMAENEEDKGMSEIKSALERTQTSMLRFEKVADLAVTSLEDEFQIKEVLNGGGLFSANHWSMLYCGGSEPVIEQLKSYRQKYGIGLSIEKFDW